MKLASRLLTLSVTAAAVVGTSIGECAEESTIVIVGAQTDPIVVRLRAELEALGFRVVVVADAEPGPNGLDAAARQTNAAAAIRIVPSKSGVEVWVGDRLTGKTVLREIVIAHPGEAADHVALQAVELLRASLLELRYPADGNAPKPAPSAVARLLPRAPIAQSPTSPLGAALGAAIAVSAGGFRPSVQALFAARYMPDRLGIELLLLAPLTSSRITSREGYADASLTTFALGGVATVARTRDRSVETAMTLGVSISTLRFHGVSSGPWRGARDDVVVLGPYAGTAIRLAIAPRLSIATQLWAGAALPRTAVRFGGREVATFGQPWLSGSLALELKWP